jgi:hypothetical protein
MGGSGRHADRVDIGLLLWPSAMASGLPGRRCRARAVGAGCGLLPSVPELRERNPNLPLSLHEALQAGRPYDPHFPIPGLPSAEPDADREAEP